MQSAPAAPQGHLARRKAAHTHSLVLGDLSAPTGYICIADFLHCVRSRSRTVQFRAIYRLLDNPPLFLNEFLVFHAIGLSKPRRLPKVVYRLTAPRAK
jgi:hypothetical protein